MVREGQFCSSIKHFIHCILHLPLTYGEGDIVVVEDGTCIQGLTCILSTVVWMAVRKNENVVLYCHKSWLNGQHYTIALPAKILARESSETSEVEGCECWHIQSSIVWNWNENEKWDLSLVVLNIHLITLYRWRGRLGTHHTTPPSNTIIK